MHFVRVAARVREHRTRVQPQRTPARYRHVVRRLLQALLVLEQRCDCEQTPQHMYHINYNMLMTFLRHDIISIISGFEKFVRGPLCRTSPKHWVRKQFLLRFK